MSNIDNFCEARKYLVEQIDPYIQTFLCGIWDPCIKFTLIRDTQKLINEDLLNKFPDVTPKYLPRVNFRLYDDVEMTQVSIQNFFNSEVSLSYLGSAGLGVESFDFYYSESFHPNFKYTYTAKFGHGFEQYYSGTKTAEAEYLLGQVTPLAVAYSMAMEDGII